MTYSVICEHKHPSSFLVKPNKKFLRYQKILDLLNILKKRKSCRANLAGMNIKKYDCLIGFYT